MLCLYFCLDQFLAQFGGFINTCQMNRERKYVQDIGFISETGAKSRGMREGEFEKIGQTCVKK